MRPFLSTHLPKSARVLPITLVLTVLLALGGGVAFAVHLASQASVVSAVNPGQPAISVTLPGKAPAFTEADVRAFYTASHGFPNGRMPTGGIPPIASITFMSREQAEANVTHHESLSELPTGALVCVLMVQGPLIHVGGGFVEEGDAELRELLEQGQAYCKSGAHLFTSAQLGE